MSGCSRRCTCRSSGAWLRRLVELARLYRDGDESAGAVIPLTQEELAGVVGTTRATLNQILRGRTRPRTDPAASRPDGGSRSSSVVGSRSLKRLSSPVARLLTRMAGCTKWAGISRPTHASARR